MCVVKNNTVVLLSTRSDRRRARMEVFRYEFFLYIRQKRDTPRQLEMFRARKRNLDRACQRVIGNCAGLLGPLPLIASYFTESNGRPHSCLPPLIYCPTKILARTIDNRRDTVPASVERDRLPRYLGSQPSRFSRHAIYKLPCRMPETFESSQTTKKTRCTVANVEHKSHFTRYKL